MMLTTWLLLFGGLTVTAIVIDGLRRMFASHAALKIDIDETLCGLPQVEYSSELPNGGARIVVAESIAVGSNNDDDVDLELYVDVDLDPMLLELEPIAVEDLAVEPGLNVQFEAVGVMLENVVAEDLVENGEPVLEDAELNCGTSLILDAPDIASFEEIIVPEPVPVCLTVEESSAIAEAFEAGEIKPNVLPEAAVPLAPLVDFDPTRPVHEWVETNSMVQSDLFAEQDLTDLATVKSQVPHHLFETSDDILFSDTGIDDVHEQGLALNDSKSLSQKNQDESLSTKLAKVTSMSFGKKLLNRKRIAAQVATNLAEVEERSKKIIAVEQVISILVTANDSQGFYGPHLRKLVEACGLVHGDMDIFHRFEDGLRLGKTQFSMASMMEPGTFNLTEMDHLHTSGVVFFLGLPTAQDSMQAFDYMLETAQCLAANLGGEVLDEQRSVMRPQTIEHCRQQIREFERRHMSRRAQL